MPSLLIYLVDENDDYVLTEDGDRILLDTITYETTGTDWRRIASTWSIPRVGAFVITRTASGAWALTVNTLTYVGTYPDRGAALEVVQGLFTNCSASDEGAEIAMAHLLATGAASIDDLQDGDEGFAPDTPWNAYRADDLGNWDGSGSQILTQQTVAPEGGYEHMSKIHRQLSTVLSPTPESGRGQDGTHPPFISLWDGTHWWTGSAGTHVPSEWRFPAVDTTDPSGVSLLNLDFSGTIHIFYHDTYTAGDSAGWGDPFA